MFRFLTNRYSKFWIWYEKFSSVVLALGVCLVGLFTWNEIAPKVNVNSVAMVAM